MSDPTGKPLLSPTAMPVSDTAQLLSKLAGQTVEPAMLEEDIAEGAPTNPDGSINLVHYAAWLVREMAQSAD